MTTENTQINLVSDNSSKFSDTKTFTFTDYLLEQLPDFYAEKIIGTEQFKFLKFLNVSEDIFDSVYSRVKNLYDSLDLNKTHPKFLYQLGQLIGLTELKDLTNSNNIEEINQQREYIRKTINRLLFKGTSESFTKLLQGIVFAAQYESLWTKDFETFIINPDRFIKDFVLSSDYSGIYEDDKQYYQGYIYTDDYDLIAEINTSLGYISPITSISIVEMNEFNTIYVLTNDGIYYRNSNNNWFQLSSTATDFRIYKDKVFLIDNNSLKIYKYDTVETVTLSSSGCSFIELITSNTGKDYLFIDTGNYLQLRDPNYLTLKNSLLKLNTNTTSYILNKENNNFVVFNINNKEIYSISLNDTLDSLSYPVSATYSYSGLITETIVNTKISKTKDNWLNLFNITDTGTLIQLPIYFAGYIPSFNKTNLNSTMFIKDVSILDNQVLFYLSLTGIGVYYFNSNIIDREITFNDSVSFNYSNILETNYLSLGKIGNKYKYQDNQNKVYIVKTDKVTGKFAINKFYGVFNYGGKLFKTHYFNILVEQDGQTILPSKLSELRSLISTILPAHVTLKSIKYNLSVLTDSVSTSDSLTSALSGNFILLADGTIEVSLLSTLSWYASGNQTADGVNTILII